MDQYKIDFLRIFANLPIPLREEIIYSDDGRPVSWSAAFIEVQGDTELGKKILGRLKEMKII
jgi:hypothetical protein